MPGAPGRPQVSGERGGYGAPDPYPPTAYGPTPGSVGRHGKAEMTMGVPAMGEGPPPGGFAQTSGDAQRVAELRAGFTPRRFGSGYDPAEVDQLFEMIAASLAGRPGVNVAMNDLEPRFRLVTGGYFEDEVDRALREVKEIFARRQG